MHYDYRLATIRRKKILNDSIVNIYLKRTRT